MTAGPEVQNERLDNGALVAAAQCERRLWLQEHTERSMHPDAQRVRAHERRRLLAWAGRRLRATRAHGDHPLDVDADAVLDARFTVDGLRIGVDALRRNGGGWDVVAVRGAAQVTRGATQDLALKRDALNRIGVSTRRFVVLLPNARYEGDLEPDPHAGLIEKDVTHAVASQDDGWEVARARVAAARAASSEPLVEPGNHCEKPRRCPFSERCGAAAAHRSGHRPEATVAVDGGFTVAPTLRASIAAVEPVTGLDFEAWSSFVPPPGLRPHALVPFLWALSSGEDDRSFIATRADDRRAFAETLLEAVGDAGSIVVWSSFEHDMLGSLGGALPDLAAPLAAVRRRLLDLHAVVRRQVSHPGFEGSSGLKRVAPVLDPTIGWSDLDAREGQEASLLGLGLFDGAFDDAQAERWRVELARYCRTDARATLRVFRRLQELVSHL